MSTRKRLTNAPKRKQAPQATTPLITGCILALNEESNIEGAIRSLFTIADKIIVIDNGSTDRTVEIAGSLGATILTAERAANFDAIRNLAITAAETDWIFFLDADERAPPGLGNTLRQLIASNGDQFAAVCIPFKHYFCGKWMSHSGWWPGFTRPQLLRRGRFKYNARLHSGVSVDGQTIYLSAENPANAIDHYSYTDVTHYLTKFNNYTDGEAESLLADGAPHSWQAQLANFVHDWQVYYERGRGDLDGVHGFVLAFLSGAYRLVSRAKLWDLRRRLGRLSGQDEVPGSVREMLEFMAQVSQEGSERWCSGRYREAIRPSNPVDQKWLEEASSSERGARGAKSKARIMGCILARNEASRIERAIRSVQGWTTSVLVIDNESDDDTAQIARRLGARVISAPDTAEFDGLRNMAIDHSDADWIFFLDADEYVTPALGTLLTRLVTEKGGEFEGISLPFKNLFYGKWMQSGVWWPGYNGPRLMKKGCFRYGDKVHTGALVEGRVRDIPPDNPEHAIVHEPYESIHDYIVKLNRYTGSEAQVYVDSAQPCTWQAMLAHFVYDWQVHYDQGGAASDGMHGFVQSFLCAFYRFVSRAKIWDILRQRGETSGDEPVPGTLREMLEFMARVSIDGPRAWLTPSAPPAPIDHCALLWDGPIWDASGYADDGRSICLGLVHAGELVHIAPGTWGENLADLTDEERALIEARCVSNNAPADLMVQNTLPWLVERRPNARFQIVRTVFETDGLMDACVRRLNSMDRVWVAAEFNRGTFAKSGVVADKIAVIPEAMDTDLYARECKPLDLRFGGRLGLSKAPRTRRAQAAGAVPYRYLSVFDWMLHKGPDLLLTAFAQEFGENPAVELVIKTWSSNGYPFDEILLQADAMLMKAAGKKLKELPNIHIFQHHMPAAQMPALYKSAQCFVIPTRGDGWLRPLMEAMASGLPSIATNWSGLTQYFNSSVGYPVRYRIEAVSEAGSNEVRVYTGQRWAEPSLTDLRRQMRYVERNREAAARKGALARNHILANYSREAIATLVQAELQICRKLAERKPWPAAMISRPPSIRIEERLRMPASRPLHVDMPAEVDFMRVLGRRLRIRWEGDFGLLSSLSHVNQELCLELLARGDIELQIRDDIHFNLLPAADRQRFALLGACAGAKLSGPLDVTIRHHWPPDWVRPTEGKLVVMQPWELSHLPTMEWVRGAQGADEVWAYSRFVRDTYVRSGVAAEKVRTVPLGVRTQVFTPAGAEFSLPNHPLTGKRPYRFLYVGGTIDRKGADIVLPTYLQTFMRESDVCLVVKDMGANSFYRGQNFAEAFRRAAADPRSAMVCYLDGEYSESEMASLYRACDCVVIPYRGEGFCLAPLEGMACGKPAIVPAGGPTDDYLDDETAFRVPHHRRYREGLFRGPGAFEISPWETEVDQAALSQAFHRANDDRRGTGVRGARARSRVETAWTWSRGAGIAIERLLDLVAPAQDTQEPACTVWNTNDMDAGRAGKSVTQLNQARIGAKVKSPTISLCMIVRNEEARIRQCLESIRPYVDEMIVVDTGSKDRTREIARECGAIVLERPWTDSFSEARNASIDAATGDWIFWFDADDVISTECGEKLRALVASCPKKDAAYQVQVLIPPGNGEYSTSTVDHVKLFPNRPDLRFEHRIHEQVLPSIRRAKLDVRFSDVYVTHLNYDRSVDGQMKKRLRDFRLLYMDLKDRPDHPFVLFNLGMTYLYATKDYEVAAHYLWRSLKCSDWRDSIVRKAYALLTTSRICQEEWELAITANEAGRSHYPDDAELLFQAGQIYQQLGRFSEGRKALERLIEGSDDPHYKSVDTSLRTHRGRHEIALLHRRLGDAPHCEEILREILASEPHYLPAWRDLVETLVVLGRDDEAREIMNHELPAARNGSGANPPLALEELPADGSLLTDCLARTRITLAPLNAKRCIVSVVSPGYESLLDSLLTSIRVNGECRDVVLAVFVIDGDDACKEVIERHGATAIECLGMADKNAMMKAVMYSASRVIDAEQFLCLDADMVVVRSLQPVFQMLEICKPSSILVCADAGLNQPTLGEELCGYYRGACSDIVMLAGPGSELLGAFPLIVNDGLFAGSRAAMDQLDATMRSMLPQSSIWCGAILHGCRNQFVFNLALAKLNCAVELDDRFNLQMHIRSVETDPDSGAVTSGGKPVHVLHYCGPSRSRHPVANRAS